MWRCMDILWNIVEIQCIMCRGVNIFNEHAVNTDVIFKNW